MPKEIKNLSRRRKYQLASNILNTREFGNQIYENQLHTSNDLKTELRFWFSQNNLSQRSTNSLIEILRNHGHSEELNNDIRSLMKTR